jgi:hypothetical protein
MTSPSDRFGVAALTKNPPLRAPVMKQGAHFCLEMLCRAIVGS